MYREIGERGQDRCVEMKVCMRGQEKMGEKMREEENRRQAIKGKKTAKQK